METGVMRGKYQAPKSAREVEANPGAAWWWLNYLAGFCEAVKKDNPVLFRRVLRDYRTRSAASGAADRAANEAG